MTVWLLLLVLTPGAAQTTAASTPIIAQNPIVTDAAARLAATVLPVEEITTIRLARFDAVFAQEMAADARLTALERVHPGLEQAVASMARAQARIAYVQAIALCQGDVAQLYQSRFTLSELTTLAKFFSTPTGHMLMILSASSDGDTASAFEANRRRQLMAMLQHPTDQMKADDRMINASGLIPKLQAIRADVSALSARRFGDVENIFSANLPEQMESTIKAYVKGAK